MHETDHALILTKQPWQSEGRETGVYTHPESFSNIFYHYYMAVKSQSLIEFLKQNLVDFLLSVKVSKSRNLNAGDFNRTFQVIPICLIFKNLWGSMYFFIMFFCRKSVFHQTKDFKMWRYSN